MAKKPRSRLSRPNAAAPAPTPVFSGVTTPSSSALLPSAYASEDEGDVQPAKFDVSTIPLQSLSLADGAPHKSMQARSTPLTKAGDKAAAAALTAAATAASDGTPSTAAGEKGKAPIKPFPFLRLPSELRVKIYAYHFEGTDAVVDLTPENYKRVSKKLLLLRTCRAIYAEASYFYYSTHTFRIFPTCPGRFFKTRRPLLARLSTSQRAVMTSMELRLGPGFDKPPKCWAVNSALGLQDCINVRRLNVFVQLDPSLSFLDGFRRAGFYETFSRDLLDNILKTAPSIDVVEFDAYESVRKNCPIMEVLLQTALEHGKRIAWGPVNGWTATADNAANTAANKPPAINANRPLVGKAPVSNESPIAAVA